MKAAVLHQYGQAPRYGEFAVPVPQGANQVVVHVTAASVKNLDKGIAAGSHCASGAPVPRTLGVDGVGRLADGTRVYAAGLTGMLAEQALAETTRLVPLPAGLDDAQAAALPNAILGSATALRFRTRLQPGETVLINGATGVTGQLAVQLARHYGAGHVVATGRNPAALARLHALGATTISLQAPAEEVQAALRAVHTQTPFQVILDYLWGEPAGLVLGVLKGTGGFTPPVRFVNVGAIAGDELPLSSGLLRSADVQLLGSGLGSIPATDLDHLYRDELPALLALAAQGQLRVETHAVPLADVEAAWHRELPGGQRLVITM